MALPSNNRNLAQHSGRVKLPAATVVCMVPAATPYSNAWALWSSFPCFCCLVSRVRKILVSVKFVSAILGPEMAAPILWTPGKNAFFLQKNLHVHKIPRFGGGGGEFWFGGGGKCRFYFYGRGDFSDRSPSKTMKTRWQLHPCQTPDCLGTKENVAKSG